MTLTASEISKLNSMCKVAQLTSLGSELGVKGTYTAVAQDATDNDMVIATGLSAISGWFVQIYRSGVNVMEDAIVTASGGDLTVSDGGVTYAVTAGDVLMYLVW